MTTSTPEKADGLKALELAIEKIKETINKLGGVFHVQMAVSKFFSFISKISLFKLYENIIFGIYKKIVIFLEI